MELPDLAAALSEAAAGTVSVLETARARPVDSLLERPGLGPVIGVWSELYRAAGVASQEGLDRAVRTGFRDAAVRGAWEEVEEAMAAWDSFLATADGDAGPGGLGVGEAPAPATPLVEARGGAATSLGAVLAEGPTEGRLHLVLLRHFA
jgi:hypothetical protein